MFTYTSSQPPALFCKHDIKGSEPCHRPFSERCCTWHMHVFDPVEWPTVPRATQATHRSPSTPHSHRRPAVQRTWRTRSTAAMQQQLHRKGSFNKLVVRLRRGQCLLHCGTACKYPFTVLAHPPTEPTGMLTMAILAASFSFVVPWLHAGSTTPSPHEKLAYYCPIALTRLAESLCRAPAAASVSAFAASCIKAPRVKNSSAFALTWCAERTRYDCNPPRGPLLAEALVPWPSNPSAHQAGEWAVQGVRQSAVRLQVCLAGLACPPVLSRLFD